MIYVCHTYRQTYSPLWTDWSYWPESQRGALSVYRCLLAWSNKQRYRLICWPSSAGAANCLQYSVWRRGRTGTDRRGRSPPAAPWTQGTGKVLKWIITTDDEWLTKTKPCELNSSSNLMWFVQTACIWLCGFFFLPTVGAAWIRDQTEAVQKVELQLSRKLVHRQGKPVVPRVMTQPTKEQQSGGQQAEVGQRGALRGLENIKTSSPHEQIERKKRHRLENWKLLSTVLHTTATQQGVVKFLNVWQKPRSHVRTPWAE